MRILYAASDQRVPGTTGGSTHVLAVAEGLAKLGHEVHAVVSAGSTPFPTGDVSWHALAPPLGVRQLRFLNGSRLVALARRLRPDVVVERYHNFGGEGLRAAKATGALAVLEVNAPMIDHPGSWKRRIDRALVVRPMRRRRLWQASMADLVVTPSVAILPRDIPRTRVLEIEWGADTERFHPGAAGAVPFRREAGTTLAIFAGAFRRWHGAVHLVRAIERLHAAGRDDIHAVLVGDGPELAPTRAAAHGLSGITFAGSLPHERMPACLATADVGVAPFDVGAHGPLALDFFWSPLKIFEYMASGLPVVTPRIPRLERLVGDAGLLYDASDPAALARSLAELGDRARRRALGQVARRRAVDRFSWSAHCRALESVFLDHRDGRAER